MTMGQHPSPIQVRQHALDRALHPDIVQALAKVVNPADVGQSQLPEKLGEAIVQVAKCFEGYLRS